MSRLPVWNIFFSRWAALAHDLLWVPAALLLSLWLRFNLDVIPPPYYHRVWHLIMLALPVQAVAFQYFGLYRGVWRFASLPDLVRIAKAVTLGSLVVFLLGMLLFRLEDVPRSVLLLYPLLLAVGLSVPRLAYRLLKDNPLQSNKQAGFRTLVFGAGSAGESLVRDLVRHDDYMPLAFIDDDESKQGREIHGIRVAGKSKDLGRLVQELEIEVVVVAIPSANRKTVQRVVRECARVDVACYTLPPLAELNDQTIEAGHLRPVTIEDLLGRESVKLDVEAIAGYLHSKRVLVTGGGGSIGSELCRQLAVLQPSRLVILENCEFNLYQIEKELSAEFPGLSLDAVLGDVKSRQRVEWVFRTFRPQVVFHAAAYKHVPMLESNPAEGVINNVIGTRMVAEAADRHGVECFVMVSTDKAVNPANVMGATKRVAELYCQNLAERSSTRFITTRFGNVLGSTGSVVPLFREQIKNRGPVTVTHPEISRYFMTIQEAVGLIMQAGSMGRGGEIFVLDMGEPVRIRELAEQMIRLSGLEPGADIPISYIGLRPGEKLHEEIFHAQEGLRGTNHAKLLLAEGRQVDWGWLLDELDSLERVVDGCDKSDDALLCHLQKLVPEFKGWTSREPNRERGAEAKIKLVRVGKG